jgi:hypothetical protein
LEVHLAEERFTNCLLDGERILWSGKPGQGLQLTEQDIFLIPFSLLWCGFAIFWTLTASQQKGAPAFFILWGGMFIYIGLYFVGGRFLVDDWIRRGLCYAVTDRRILIARPAPFSKIARPAPFSKFTALSLERLPAVDLIERANGQGTIRFGQHAPAWAWGNRGMSSLTPALDPTPQFLGIDDARRVFELIQRTAGKRQ